MAGAPDPPPLVNGKRTPFQAFPNTKRKAVWLETANCLPPIFREKKRAENFFEKNAIFFEKRLAFWFSLCYNSIRQVKDLR